MSVWACPKKCVWESHAESMGPTLPQFQEQWGLSFRKSGSEARCRVWVLTIRNSLRLQS